MKTHHMKTLQYLRITVLALLAAVWLVAPSAFAQTAAQYQATGEEFVGPFASWKNVKTDFGAKGDGITDDAPAIQKALDELKGVQTNNWSVLYFPAGRYRLGSTLHTERTKHSDYLGAQIIGEDPATTVLLWGGPDNGTMLAFDSWYSRVSRLTFDGQGRALDGIFHGRSYSTFDEWSELVFKDFRGRGIAFSWNGQTNSGTGKGCDAQHIIRCAFIRCEIGLAFVDWNNMDDNIWYCYFEDCGTAIYNPMCGYHAVGNVFVRSRTVDITGGSVPAYIADNVSIGSKTFLDSKLFGQRLLQRNRVYDTGDTIAISHKRGNPGAQPLVMLDNTVVSKATNTGAAVHLESENSLLVGNTFTVPRPLEVEGTRTVSLDQKIVRAATVAAPAAVPLPGVNPRVERPVFEVTKGKELQAQITAACQAAVGGVVPVVHIPKGIHTIANTVTIPANRAIQVVGDGGSENGTVLRWGGTGRGPMLKLEGPSRATLRDLCLSSTGTGADVVLVDNCDQVGGRVYGDQLIACGSDANAPVDKAYFVDGVDHTDITLRNSQFASQKSGGVYVTGGPLRAAGRPAEGQVAYLCGENANDGDNLYNVVDGGRLVVIGQTHEIPKEVTAVDLRSSGALTIALCRIAMTPSTKAAPFFSFDGFKGTATFIANNVGNGYNQSEMAIFCRLTGDGRDGKVLNACNTYGTGNSTTATATWQDSTNPAAAAAMLDCEGGAVNQPQTHIPNVVNKVANVQPDPQFIRDSLAQLRALCLEPPNTRPPGVTDVKLIRVIMKGGANTTVLRFKGGQP